MLLERSKGKKVETKKAKETVFFEIENFLFRNWGGGEQRVCHKKRGAYLRLGHFSTHKYNMHKNWESHFIARSRLNSQINAGIARFCLIWKSVRNFYFRGLGFFSHYTATAVFSRLACIQKKFTLVKPIRIVQIENQLRLIIFFGYRFVTLQT